MTTPSVDQLGSVVAVLRRWQREDAPIQLHPGDLGWSARAGDEALAAALRVWSRDGGIVAVGFLDGPDVLRLTVAPSVWDDDDVAGEVVADLASADASSVEVPDGTRVRSLLSASGWREGEAWSPLRLGLAEPVAGAQLAAEVVTTARQVAECAAVHRSAWGSAAFTDERWQVMASGVAFADALCLLGRDAGGVAVATLTVWTAGPGRPALIEPLGVHADHRRRGYGAALCRTAAARVRELGSSSVLVCTPSSLVSAVATYRSAGFGLQPERLDLVRDV